MACLSLHTLRNTRDSQSDPARPFDRYKMARYPSLRIHLFSQSILTQHTEQDQHIEQHQSR